MSCNCKKKTVKDKVTGEVVEKIVRGNIIISTFLFLFSIIIIPFLYPVMIIILFKHFFFGGNINLVKILSKLKKKDKFEDDEEIDIEMLNPDDYEVIGVDTIEPIKNE